jgi:hypothetical protein
MQSNCTILPNNIKGNIVSLCLKWQIFTRKIFFKTFETILCFNNSGYTCLYRSSDFGDELAWSAAWLYRATNDISYLNDAKAFYTQYGLSNNPSEFSWDSKTAGVQVTYKTKS